MKRRARGGGRAVRAAVMLITAVLLITAAAYRYFFPNNYIPAEGTAVFRFIDVGEGDCTLITTRDATVLVDTGTTANAPALAAGLTNLGVRRIDLLILTHPHEDHIGGAATLAEEFQIGEILTSVYDYDCASYRRLTDAVEQHDAVNTAPVTLSTVKSGDTLSVGGLSIKFFAPNSAEYDEPNDSSLVTRVSFGDTSALLTGDAEAASERDILDTYFPFELHSDILKVGHHGSSTSTTPEFLAAVAPDYAVISCEAGNSYGHPHMTTLYRLGEADAFIFVTFETGDITFTSDGSAFTYETEKNVSVSRGYAAPDIG